MRTQSFGQNAGSRLDNLIFSLRARRILSRFPPRVGNAVDLGSGFRYRMLRHLLRKRRIDTGIAIDIALDSAAPAGLTTVEADVCRQLPLNTNSADVVLSLAVLEHVIDPAAHMREAYRILRSPGLLLLTSPSRLSKPLLEFLAFRLHLIDADEIRDHKHYFSEVELRDLLVEVGFDEGRLEYRRFLFGLNQFVVAAK